MLSHDFVHVMSESESYVSRFDVPDGHTLCEHQRADSLCTRSSLLVPVRFGIARSLSTSRRKESDGQHVNE